MAAIDKLENLKTSLPDLFEDYPLPDDWDDSYELYSVSNPGDIEFDDNQEQIGSIYLGDMIPEVDPFLLNDEKLGAIFSGGWPGGLQKAGPGAPPPPDALAFYLPFHYFTPDWWGIYLRAEGVFWLANYLERNAPGIGSKLAFDVSTTFLYYHEAFHHKFECFATRLELSHRTPLYRKGFESFYQITVGTDDCLEEALANAFSLEKTGSALKGSVFRERIVTALSEYIKISPPGYRKALEHLGERYKHSLFLLSEKSHGIALPMIPACNSDIWGATSHMYDPIANIKMRVNYILPVNSPLENRIPLPRKQANPARIRRALKKLVGLKPLKERKGRHPMYETSSGRRFPIPCHPGDLPIGTLKTILKQAGLNMSLSQFKQHL